MFVLFVEDSYASLESLSFIGVCEYYKNTLHLNLIYFLQMNHSIEQ
jgi:hypothetical protein